MDIGYPASVSRHIRSEDRCETRLKKEVHPEAKKNRQQDTHHGTPDAGDQSKSEGRGRASANKARTPEEEKEQKHKREGCDCANLPWEVYKGFSGDIDGFDSCDKQCNQRPLPQRPGHRRI